MLPDIQPGNTKILYFFNCLLDGMHTTFILRGRLFGVYLACGKSDFNFFSAVASINLIRFTWFTSLAPGS